MLTDLPQPELHASRSSQTDPPDFDSFWASTLAESGAFPLQVSVTPVDSGLRTIDVFDVTFPGYRGHPVKAWRRLPVGVAEPVAAPAWFSTALMDSLCPPSIVFAAFADYRGDKRITDWPHNGHEGGQIEDELGARAVLRRASTSGASTS